MNFCNGLAIGLVLVATSGCVQRKFNSSVKADVGIPTSIPMRIIGTYATTGSPVASLVFTQKDASGVETKIEHPAVVGSGIGIIVDNNKYGQPLLQNPSEADGLYSNTPWKCVDAETMALGAPVTVDASQLCHLEMNATAEVVTTPAGTSYGYALSIIGLDRGGEGLKDFKNTTPALNQGPLLSVSSGSPKAPNSTIDEAVVTQALLDARKHYNSPVGERNDCLKNLRTSDWLDIQAHYYCQLPKSPVRECYTTALVKGRDALQAAAAAAIAAGGAAPTPQQQLAGLGKVYAGAFEACFSTAGATNDGQKWIAKNQADVFKYIMFTKPGVWDFNLESENDVINAFYSKLGEKRPRRIADTFPAWLPDQPRYERVRKSQNAVIAAATSAAPATSPAN